MLESHSDDLVLPTGSTLSGRYVLDSFLGSGGMGSVYLCRDTLLEDKVVAIKVLHQEFSRDAELTRRFLREVNMMHSVNHPNVVRTFDAGVENGVFYFTMEYVEGLLLDEYLEAAGRDYVLLGRIIAQICKGLEAIHGQKIVHRDLKPGNILVSESGFVKITDFGVARPISSGNTTHREIMGSLDYIPPEVFQGHEIKPASDFYSLGVILYGIVTGAFPFEADDPMAIVWKHVHEEAIPPRELSDDVPQWLDSLIIRLLSKDPNDRPQTAREIIRFVRENLYNKKGDTLDSGSYQAPSDEAIKEFSQRDSTIFDTDSFELGESSNAALEEYYDESIEPEKNRPEEIDEFNSACHQVIFDALPTGDAIRKHEREWQEKKRQRTDGSLASEMQEPQNKKDFKKIARITIAIVLLLTFFGGLFLFFKILPEIEQRENELKPKSIDELRKEYYSSDDVSPLFKKKASTQNRLSNQRNPKKRKSTFFKTLAGLFESEPESEERVYDTASSSTVFNTATPLSTPDDESSSGFSFKNPFKLDHKKYGKSADGESATAKTLWTAPSKAKVKKFKKSEIPKLYSQRKGNKFNLKKFKGKNPKAKSVFASFEALFGDKRKEVNIKKATPSELAVLESKNVTRSNLREIEAKREAISISNEKELSGMENETKEELSELRKAINYVMSSFEDQSYHQEVLTSLLDEGQTKELLETAEALSKLDPKVNKQFIEYKNIESKYREVLDIVSSGQADATVKKRANQVGSQLSREREKLRAYVNAAIASSIREGQQDITETAQALQVLKQKELELEKGINDRRNYWKKSQEGESFDLKKIEEEKQVLENKLSELETELDEKKENDVRKSSILESLGF